MIQGFQKSKINQTKYLNRQFKEFFQRGMRKLDQMDDGTKYSNLSANLKVNSKSASLFIKSLKEE